MVWDTQHLQQKKIENFKKITGSLETMEGSGKKLEKIDHKTNGIKQNLENQSDIIKQKLNKLQEPEKVAKEEAAISKSDIKILINLIRQIEIETRELSGLKKFIHDEISKEALEKGKIDVKKYRNYYDIVNTIKKEGPIDPQDFDSPVYNIERVFEDLERYSDIVSIVNGGTQPLFTIVSHEGRTNFSKESVIFPGEVKSFYHVYELRLRSPENGLLYRVTEYLIQSVSQTSLIPIELASLHDVKLPDTGEDWLETDIIPLITPTTFRIQVSVSIAGNFFSVITKDENEEVVLFNAISGPELIEDGIYIFDLLVHKGDSVNFRYSTDHGKIKILRIQEIDAATA